MKETPTEERGEAHPQAAAAQVSADAGESTHAPVKQGEDQALSARPSAPPDAPARPPRRERLDRRRSPYSRPEKVIIWSLLIVAFVAALPIGAYLALKLSERQQGPAAGVTPTATVGVAPPPKALDPERREALFIDQMIRRMSLDEELGQMMIVEFSGSTFNDDLQYMLVNQHAGGTILYGSNVQNAAQLAALDAASQAHASIPLFISTDQEGGLVNRLLPITGPRPSAQAIGASNDPNSAYEQGVADGQMLKQLGINLNLAPVVDVQTVSDSATVLPTRMFGTTPQKVATFAGAYLTGLQEQGVIGVLKHWPGLGAATIDPHDALPIFTRSRQNLNNIDFAPYRTLLAQNKVDMIMSTHEVVTAYDPKMPASVSPIMIDQVLRHDLGYQGVVITDGLYMGALKRWTVPQAAVLAVIAGNDLLLGPWKHDQVQQVLDALHAAINSGQITKARIDLSVERILALKIKYGLIHVPATLPAG